MLDHILRQVKRFESEHQREPNTLFLNPDHVLQLKACCPGLFSDPTTITLGLSIQVWPKESLPHPRVAYLDCPAHMLGYPQFAYEQAIGVKQALVGLINMQRKRQRTYNGHH